MLNDNPNIKIIKKKIPNEFINQLYSLSSNPVDIPWKKNK